MSNLLGNLKAVAASPHTSIPGFIALACIVGGIWLPKYKDQFRETQGAVLAYAAIMASQIKPKDAEPVPTPEK
jgi:hypothetical protein